MPGILSLMTEKIPCKYCGLKCHPRKIKKHETECRGDQKGPSADKPKALTKGGMIRVCKKCGVETEIFVLDGAKCKGCDSSL
jgi:hypothetical protein